jgi:transcription antitermination factor NusG
MPGIINVIYWLGKPAVIRDSEIEVIKRFLCEYVNIRLEKRSIAINDKIQILGGPLVELEGKVLSIGNNTVKVALPSLGYMMFAEIETSNVKVISHIPAEMNMNYPLYAAR